MQLFRSIACGVTLALVALAPVSAQTAQPVWAQSFLTPATQVFLESISIGGQAGGPIEYNIFKTDGLRALVGSLFTQSAPTVSMSDVETFTPHVLLDANTTYILAMNFPHGGSANDSPDYFVGGQLYFLADGDGDGWTLDRGPDDLFDSYDWQNFSVTFSPVAAPEPRSMTLLAIGLVAILAGSRRRKRSSNQ